MSTITHEVRGGFCIQCGDTEEWLRSTGETVVDADAPKVGPYTAEVQFSDRTGIWSGVTRKAGNTRRTDVCVHGHKTEAAAVKCSEKLRDLRNAR